MNRKFWNWVKNSVPDEFGNTRTLYLDGQISEETWWGDEVTPEAFRKELFEDSGGYHAVDQQSWGAIACCRPNLQHADGISRQDHGQDDGLGCISGFGYCNGGEPCLYVSCCNPHDP